MGWSALAEAKYKLNEVKSRIAMIKNNHKIELQLLAELALDVTNIEDQIKLLDV